MNLSNKGVRKAILEYEWYNEINDRTYLLAVLVGDNGTGRCSCIST